MSYFGKKIFLARDGILSQSLRLEGAKTFDEEDIEIMDFSTFIEAPDNLTLNIMNKFGAYYFDQDKATLNWNNTFEAIINRKEF